MASHPDEQRNFVGGTWRQPTGTDLSDVWNPATGEVIAQVRSSSAQDVGAAVEAARLAVVQWRRTPPNERAQWLYRLKTSLEENLEALARCITEEHGKLVSEARGEVGRAVDNVEMACGTPAHLQGLFSEDVARGIDETLVRQPVGVCAAIVPFNFPLMI